jgi:hypothetical protein
VSRKLVLHSFSGRFSLYQENQYGAGIGALHTMNRYGSPTDSKWFGGTALAIAYTSDVGALQPNDMTVISVNYDSVWTRQISYSIPAGLPPCPPGGCLCTWNWIHTAGNGEGYPYEIVSLCLVARGGFYLGLDAVLMTVQQPLQMYGDWRNRLDKEGPTGCCTGGLLGRRQ